MLSPQAEAFWNGSYAKPKFAHHLCWPIADSRWRSVGNTLDLKDGDRCMYCGGSMFAEPVE